MKISLALCTYNRAKLLEGALASLAAAQPPGCEWELLLINNNSTDQTHAVTRGFADRLPVRYIFEPLQGLAAARNRALRECTGDVLLFTDDDLSFEPDWIVGYERAFTSHPQAAWFGGRVRPLWASQPPAWLHDESLELIAGLLVRYDLGCEDRLYTDTDPTPFGASFAIRRSAFERLPGFRLDLGVRGDVPGRGEEAEYLARLRGEGTPGFYVGRSCAWHWQDARRFALPYLYRFGVQKGIAETRIPAMPPTTAGSRLRELSFGLKAIYQAVKGRGDRARQCVINMGIERGLRKR